MSGDLEKRQPTRFIVEMEHDTLDSNPSWLMSRDNRADSWQIVPYDEHEVAARAAAEAAKTTNTGTKGPPNIPPSGPGDGPEGSDDGGSDDSETLLNEDDAENTAHHVFCDPNNPADVTVNLRLPIVKDLGDELEEFDRLKRTGQFKEAQSFFDSHLDRHIDDPYVFVQYAHLLLEMDDHVAFENLNPHDVLSNTSDKRMLLLNWTWTLLECLSLLRRDPTAESVSFAQQKALEAVEKLEVRSTSDLPFTELRLVSLTLRLFAALRETAPNPVFIALASKSVNNWLDWSGICGALLEDRRDWDFRDLVVSAAAAFGQQEFAKRISGGGVLNFNISWDEFAADESASLAHLDLLVSVVKNADPAVDTMRMERDRRDAKSLAQIIMQHHPRAMRSRPFANWILIEAAMAGRQKAAQAKKKGQDFYETNTKLMQLPLQIPKTSSLIPGWRYVDVTGPGSKSQPHSQVEAQETAANQPVQVALTLATDMDDFATQADCYRLLALRRREQGAVLQELALMQETLGDRHGQLESVLARYYGCHDIDSQMALLDELAALESDLGPMEMSHGGIGGTKPPPPPLVRQVHRGVKACLIDKLPGNGGNSKDSEEPKEPELASAAAAAASGGRRAKRSSLLHRSVPLDAGGAATSLPDFPMIRPKYGPAVPGKVDKKKASSTLPRRRHASSKSAEGKQASPHEVSQKSASGLEKPQLDPDPNQSWELQRRDSRSYRSASPEGIRTVVIDREPVLLQIRQARSQSPSRPVVREIKMMERISESPTRLGVDEVRTRERISKSPSRRLEEEMSRRVKEEEKKRKAELRRHDEEEEKRRFEQEKRRLAEAEETGSFTLEEIRTSEQRPKSPQRLARETVYFTNTTSGSAREQMYSRDRYRSRSPDVVRVLNDGDRQQRRVPGHEGPSCGCRHEGKTQIVINNYNGATSDDEDEVPYGGEDFYDEPFEERRIYQEPVYRHDRHSAGYDSREVAFEDQPSHTRGTGSHREHSARDPPDYYYDSDNDDGAYDVNYDDGNFYPTHQHHQHHRRQVSPPRRAPSYSPRGPIYQEYDDVFNRDLPPRRRSSSRRMSISEPPPLARRSSYNMAKRRAQDSSVAAAVEDRTRQAPPERDNFQDDSMRKRFSDKRPVNHRVETLRRESFRPDNESYYPNVARLGSHSYSMPPPPPPPPRPTNPVRSSSFRNRSKEDTRSILKQNERISSRPKSVSAEDADRIEVPAKKELQFDEQVPIRY